MTFEQAIAAAKAGTHVKRSNWNNHYLKKQSGTDETVIETVYVRTIVAPYTATQEDMTADDWINA